MPKVELLTGDCRALLRAMKSRSVDAIVCDPPYELGFMGKAWDASGIAFQRETWVECLRVLKPGGHLLAFGGSRTAHRITCAIEDAGFEIRDTVMWLYGSGFPKSRNIGGGWGTALKPAHEPITVARKPLAEGTVAANVLEWGTGAINVDGCRVATSDSLGGGAEKRVAIEGKHEGWARPWMHDAEAVEAHASRVTANVAKAEALGRWPANIVHDGSDEVVGAFPETTTNAGTLRGDADKGRHIPLAPIRKEGTFLSGGDTGSAARFFASCPPCDTDYEWHHLENSDPTASSADSPSGLCETSIAAEAVETRSLASKSEASLATQGSTGNSNGSTLTPNPVFTAESRDNTGITQTTPSHSTSFGSAHPVTVESIRQESLALNTSSDARRFAYFPKASKADRDAGLEDMPEVRAADLTGRVEGSVGLVGDDSNRGQTANPFAGTSGPVRRNTHPTVKPTSLMRYLCRLVTPPGGTILDPFMGSGSTGRAAVLEGFDFIGIDLSPEYVAIAERRIADAQRSTPQLSLLEAAE